MTDLLIKELEQMGKHPSVRLNTDRQVWKEAAAMLRRQHEAIKQLQEPVAHHTDEALRKTVADAEQALADTEECK